ncbi:hypothetical protein QFC19_001102 [Naganishia cerealis]|uniref:Uncharacterized protein n=1 Tax=Naganishia cerealis TaxID=610337 RepID=A0ACC2WK76_9TREE|nr:hypothetical protein QFC19_001102 [Naganishia cerealis]
MEQFSTYSPVRVWIAKPVPVPVGIYYVRLVPYDVIRLEQDNFPDQFAYESFLFSRTEQPTLHFRDCVQVSDQTFLDDIPLSEAVIELSSSESFTFTRLSPVLQYVVGHRLLIDPVNYYQNMEGTGSSPVARSFSILSVPEYQLPGVVAGIVTPTLDISAPPSLSASVSNFSGLGSPQYVLGTPCFHPADGSHHVVTPTEVRNYSDPLHVGIEIVLEPDNGDHLEMFGTSKTG